MGTIAGVDHVGLEEAREEVWRAGGLVADDDNVGIERLQCSRGVLEAFALLE